MKTQQINPFAFFEGEKLTFQTPSGHIVTIREQSAEDDEILSKLNPERKEEMIKNLNAFLPTIIRENTYNNKASIDASEVSEIKLKDKYYILLKTRLHSIGKNLKFDARCPNDECLTNGKRTIVPFKEDLSRYDTDLSKFDEDAERYEYQITPHKGGKELKKEFKLASGKKLRYTYMNIASELRGSQLDIISDNTDIDLRNLEMFNPDSGEWQIVQALNLFSKREKIEIRAEVDAMDAQWLMFLELKCPKCKREWVLPFLYLKDFFFPTEI